MRNVLGLFISTGEAKGEKKTAKAQTKPCHQMDGSYAWPMLPQTAAQRTSAEQWQELRQVAGLCLFCLVWPCAYASVLACLMAVTFQVAATTTTHTAARNYDTINSTVPAHN